MQHADQRTKQTASLHKPTLVTEGSLPSRNTGQIHKIDPGKVFDLTLPLDRAADGYRAMDERRAIKTLLQP